MSQEQPTLTKLKEDMKTSFKHKSLMEKKKKKKEGIISLHRVDRTRGIRNNFHQELFWLENRKKNTLFATVR